MAFSFSIQQSAAQTISGTVNNAETGEPLAGANILQVDSRNGTSTQANGTFLLSLIDEGAMAIKISYVGYKSKTVQINSSSNNLEIVLQPNIKTSL
jgi:hypothetical protein